MITFSLGTVIPDSIICENDYFLKHSLFELCKICLFVTICT